MTDNTKKIIDRLNEAESNRRKRKKLLRDSIDECVRLKKEYAEKLRTETDPEAYNELVKLDAENENKYTALLRQKEQKTPPALSRAEFESIRKEIRHELAVIQALYAPEITDLLSKIVPVVNAYVEDVEELERTENGALSLSGVVGFNTTMDISTIKDHAPDDIRDVIGAFMYGYYINQGTFRKYKGQD